MRCHSISVSTTMHASFHPESWKHLCKLRNLRNRSVTSTVTAVGTIGSNFAHVGPLSILVALAIVSIHIVTAVVPSLAVRRLPELTMPRWFQHSFSSGRAMKLLGATNRSTVPEYHIKIVMQINKVLNLKQQNKNHGTTLQFINKHKSNCKGAPKTIASKTYWASCSFLCPVPLLFDANCFFPPFNLSCHLLFLLWFLFVLHPVPSVVRPSFRLSFDCVFPSSCHILCCNPPIDNYCCITYNRSRRCY